MEFYVALILDILPPEPCENDFLACTLPVCGTVYGDLSRPTQSQAVIPAAHAGVVLKTGVLLGVRGGTCDSYQFCSQTVLWNFSFSQYAFSCVH